MLTMISGGTLRAVFGDFRFRQPATECSLTPKCRDILYELASAGSLPLPRASPPATNKRDRDAEDVPNTPESTSSTASIDAPRQVAGSRRVAAAAPRTVLPVVLARQQPQSQPVFLANDTTTMDGSAPSSVLGASVSQAAPPLQPAYTSTLGGWYGYDSAGSHQQQASQQQVAPGGVYGPSAQPSQPAPTDPQSFQTLDVGHMFSTQSMMYDQVLSNLSASLSGRAPHPPAKTQTQTTADASGSSALFTEQAVEGISAGSVQVPPDNFTDLLASFGEDYGAIFPDFNNDGTLNFSTWPNIPQELRYVFRIS
jgi:hypothetical protein